MGAVDADDLGAAADKIGDEVRVVGRLARQRDENAARPSRRRRPEHLGGIGLKPRLAAEELAFGRRPGHGLPGPGEGGERHGDGVERGQHPPLEAPERRDAERHQPALQEAEVAVPHGEVLGEVQRTRDKAGALDPGAPGPVGRTAFARHGRPERKHLVEHGVCLVGERGRDGHEGGPG